MDPNQPVKCNDHSRDLIKQTNEMTKMITTCIDLIQENGPHIVEKKIWIDSSILNAHTWIIQAKTQESGFYAWWSTPQDDLGKPLFSSSTNTIP